MMCFLFMDNLNVSGQLQKEKDQGMELVEKLHYS